MPKELHLLTAMSDFDRLHKLAEGRKAMVSGDCVTLSQLLTDHSVLVAGCQGAGIKVIEPTPQRSRPRLKP